ncbi:hypothetical protein PAPHI01_1480 [Pancytospora philotis]|nr:hypothetical protein PAPHI01_1480 [Pancytospora philotis]
MHPVIFCYGLLQLAGCAVPNPIDANRKRRRNIDIAIDIPKRICTVTTMVSDGVLFDSMQRCIDILDILAKSCTAVKARADKFIKNYTEICYGRFNVFLSGTHDPDAGPHNTKMDPVGAAIYACHADDRKAWDEPYSNQEIRRGIAEELDNIITALKRFKHHTDFFALPHPRMLENINKTGWLFDMCDGDRQSRSSPGMKAARNTIVQIYRKYFKAMNAIADGVALDPVWADEPTYTALTGLDWTSKTGLYNTVHDLVVIFWAYNDLIYELYDDRDLIKEGYMECCEMEKNYYKMLPNEFSRLENVNRVVQGYFKKQEDAVAEFVRTMQLRSAEILTNIERMKKASKIRAANSSK